MGTKKKRVSTATDFYPHFFKLHLKEGRLPYHKSDIDTGFIQKIRNVFFRFQQIHHAH